MLTISWYLAPRFMQRPLVCLAALFPMPDSFCSNPDTSQGSDL